MKKTIIYSAIALILIIIIWVLVVFKANKVENENIKVDIPYIKHTNELILKDVDFSIGKYALYIKHKEFGEFAVVDQELLKANRDSLKVKLSLSNFFPGELDRSYGVLLFENNELINQTIGGIFEVFEIGDLKKGSIPVREYVFNGVKSVMKIKIDSLKKNKNSYITDLPELPKDDKEFHFQVDFPSIAVPATQGLDKNGNQNILTVNGIEYSKWNEEKENEFDEKWASKIENCIKNKAGKISDFEISISKRGLGSLYLFDVKKDRGNELRNAENIALSLDDYFCYQYTANISANKENAKKLFAIDYNGCINDVDRNKANIIAKTKELVKQSSKPNLSVDKGEVEIKEYKNFATKSKTITEQKYQVNWLEIGK